MKLYRIGFELSKLHASIYLALFADAYAGLQCCFTVHVCHLSLYLQDRPGSDIELRMYRLNVWLFKIIVQM